MTQPDLGVSSSLCKRPGFVFGFGDGVAGEGGSFPFSCTSDLEALSAFMVQLSPGLASVPAKES
jgi:hypothetical protein